MGSFDFVTFFFFVAAVIIFLQLRSVLGRRTGHERSPEEIMRRDRPETDGRDDPKVVTLPRRNREGEPAPDRFAAADAYAPADSDLNKGLRAVMAADQQFNPKEFLKGAGIAYEMIVNAFAEGDRKALKSLLSREVYEGFVSAIEERESRGETVRSRFVGIGKADITQAEMKGSDANVTVRIVSQLISATLDKNGEVVEGDLEEVADVNDVWTFSRDTRSRDPNWKLIATEADQ